MRIRRRKTGWIPLVAMLLSSPFLQRPRAFVRTLQRSRYSTVLGSTLQEKHEQLQQASKLSLAPMMEYTDRHFRTLIRLISNRTLLYTEMVAANTLCHERTANQEKYLQDHPTASVDQLAANYRADYLRRFLGQAPNEGPCVLQLGGSSVDQMRLAAQTVLELTDYRENWCDYTAINLNCGCPSPKVAGKGCFGAALMDDAHLVGQLTQALDQGCNGRLPITVKCRIGTDGHMTDGFTASGYAEMNEDDEYQKLSQFIETVASYGVVTDFQVHARIAVLGKSFSPAANRKIPPLKYHLVRRLADEYKDDFTFSLNGGLETIGQVQEELEACPNLHGIMIGRALAADPWRFAMTDPLLYGEVAPPVENRWQVLERFGAYADEQEAMVDDPSRIRRFILKAITPLFAGEHNAKRYRIALDDLAVQAKKDPTLAGQRPLSQSILDIAQEHLSQDVLFESPQQSHERFLWNEAQQEKRSLSIPTAVQEWQTERKASSSGAASAS